MKYITLKIPENRLAFFMELITALGFVEVKKTETALADQELLSEEEKKKIDERLAAAKENSYQGLSLEQVNQHLADKYGI